MSVLEMLLIPMTNIELLLLVALGTFAGMFVGAIPGLSVTMGVALLLSLTYSMDVYAALAIMLGVLYGGVFGGSRAAILVNMPGTAATIATTFDGYPLNLRGETGIALSLTTIASSFGSLIGVFFLAVFSPMIASVALEFSPRDYFLVAMMGILLIGSVSEGSISKGIFVGCLGILLGLVGIDSLNAAQRFTFGFITLMNGINEVSAILGLFGLAEVLYQLKKLKENEKPVKLNGKSYPPLRVLIRLLPLKLRVSLLGVLVGALPGVGAEIAALLGYDHAKRTVKKPNRPFGQGSYEGVVAPEAANNAAVGGTLIPMLTLGIPGDSVTALFISALIIQGLQPGPLLMTNTPELFWMIVGSSLLASIFILIFGLLVVKIFIRVVSVPKPILLPIITIISIVGAYSMNNSIHDVYWMLGFGIMGFFLRIYKFPVGPMILGVILGPLIDVSFRRAYIMADSNLLHFLVGFFSTPISAILTFGLLFTIFSQTPVFEKIKVKFMKDDDMKLDNKL